MIKTKRGLPNTDALTGEPIEGFGFARNSDEARSGLIFATSKNLRVYFGEEEPDGQVPPHEELSVEEIKKIIAATEDPGVIKGLLEDEMEGKQRITALDALESRLAELEPE